MLKKIFNYTLSDTLNKRYQKQLIDQRKKLDRITEELIDLILKRTTIVEGNKQK